MTEVLLHQEVLKRIERHDATDTVPDTSTDTRGQPVKVSRTRTPQQR